MSDLYDRLSKALGDAISGVIQDHEHGMATGWVAIVESVDDTGERGLWTFNAGHMRAWDTVGFISYARDLQRAATMRKEE